MHTKRKSGFTLIELLLVVSIIAVLIAMLLPAIEAVQRAGFINETRNRIAIISGAINQYANTYDGMIPPSTRSESVIWDYPIVQVPTTAGNVIDKFDPNDRHHVYSTNFGHSYLVYFLMGPDNVGWDVGDHGVRKNWHPPDALKKMMTDFIILPGSTNHNANTCRGYYAFKDAWGPQGTGKNAAGCFHYSVPDPRTGGYNRYDMYQAYYQAGVNGSSAFDHIARLYRNIGSEKYILVSAGPDKRLGYYMWDKATKKYVPNAALGYSDDISNVPVD